jgi:hypothetical protein
MSSFKPSNNAKLYASPEDIKSVGFRPRPLSTPNTRTPVSKLIVTITYIDMGFFSSFVKGIFSPMLAVESRYQ